MTLLLLVIPALPLLAALSIALGQRVFRGRSHRIAVAAVVTACGSSVAGLVHVIAYGPVELPLYTLLTSGRLTIDMTLYLDHLAAVVLILVTGVSSIVHLYSVRYMQGDPQYDRFFALISLFTGLMATLVLSANLFMLYLCWELMGLCSYLLISHRAERPAACQAATKAFLVNAVADVGLSLGVLLSFVTFGTLDLRQIIASVPDHTSDTLAPLGWAGLEGDVSTLTVIAILLFIGASGKSAQLPFHVWLPLAMEAPTPVSALIHAATMVNAGVFLVVRLHPLYAASPVAMGLLTLIGGTTALFAGLVSLTQPDIKRTLAYSTISQLGFMMLACGVGAFGAAVFHLLAHGALKAFLFLSTGNAVQAAAHRTPHGVQAPGPLIPGRLPWGSAVAALLLAFVPALVIFSPAYARLWGMAGHAAATVTFWLFGLGTVFLAASALCRHLLTIPAAAPAASWPGRPAGQAPLTLPPTSATVLVLAAVVLGGILVLAWGTLGSVLAPVFASPADTGGWPARLDSGLRFGLPLSAMVAGWGMALIGAWAPRARVRFQGLATPRTYVMLLNAGHLDERYDAWIVTPVIRGARWLWRSVDVRTIDGAVTAGASLSVRLAAWLWQVIDIRGIDRSVTGTGTLTVTWAQWLWSVIDVRTLDKSVHRVGGGADRAGHALQRIEPRMLQHHLMMAVFWVAVALALFYLLLR